jgi:hypothetical protein
MAMSVSRPDRGTANRPTCRSGLWTAPLYLSVPSPSYHAQCRLFPFPSLPSQFLRFRQPAPFPPPSTYLSQPNAHHPTRFLSQAPTSRDPFLARQDPLRPPTTSKAPRLVTVGVAPAEIRYSRLSPRHRRPGCARTTRSPARLC